MLKDRDGGITAGGDAEVDRQSLARVRLVECCSEAFIEIGFKTLDRADDCDMRDLFQRESVRNRGCRFSQRIPSSAPRSAGVPAGCEVSVHLPNADAADEDDNEIPYQTGNCYDF